MQDGRNTLALVRQNIVQELCINVEATIMAWRNVLSCTHPGTKFNSYPTFKELSTEQNPCP